MGSVNRFTIFRFGFPKRDILAALNSFGLI
jgi:hypothetical protein